MSHPVIGWCDPLSVFSRWIVGERHFYQFRESRRVRSALVRYALGDPDCSWNFGIQRVSGGILVWRSA